MANRWVPLFPNPNPASSGQWEYEKEPHGLPLEPRVNLLGQCPGGQVKNPNQPERRITPLMMVNTRNVLT
jgi:hypothetical protein